VEGDTGRRRIIFIEVDKVIFLDFSENMPSK
jgi:hypothetical protein